MFKINNKNNRTFFRSGVFIVNFEHILHLFYSISIVDFEQVNLSWAGVFQKAPSNMYFNKQNRPKTEDKCVTPGLVFKHGKL